MHKNFDRGAADRLRTRGAGQPPQAEPAAADARPYNAVLSPPGEDTRSLANPMPCAVAALARTQRSKHTSKAPAAAPPLVAAEVAEAWGVVLLLLLLGRGGGGQRQGQGQQYT